MTALLTTDGEKETITTAEDFTTVLVVDDSAAARRFVGQLVERRRGFRAVYACSGQEALAVLGRETCAAVVTDLHMPGMDGLELVEAIRDRHPLTPIALMTAEGSEETAVKALQGGAASYVSKHALERELLDTLDQVLAAARIDRRRQRCSNASAIWNVGSCWRTTRPWSRC